VERCDVGGGGGDQYNDITFFPSSDEIIVLTRNDLIVSTARMAVSMLKTMSKRGRVLLFVVFVERRRRPCHNQLPRCLKLFGNCCAVISQLSAQIPVLYLPSHHTTAPTLPLLCPELSSPIFPSMIRRNPTLIAMGDADVQDVRNMLAKKQAEATKNSNSTTNAKGKQGPPPQPPAAVTAPAAWYLSSWGGHYLLIAFTLHPMTNPAGQVGYTPPRECAILPPSLRLLSVSMFSGEQRPPWNAIYSVPAWRQKLDRSSPSTSQIFLEQLVSYFCY
jgi:hypothetical protein